MSKTSFILVEDDTTICMGYKNAISEYPNLYLTDITNSSKIALELVKKFNPHAVVLDLELHHGEGNGITFLKELSHTELKNKPFVLVVTNNISPITHKMARNYGADLILTKTQGDYSIPMVLEFLNSLGETDVFSGSDEHGDSQNLLKYRNNISSAIKTELDLIGVSSKLKGRKYLELAIELVYDKPRPNLCAEIGTKFGVTDSSVERAIQTAINYAWRNTDIETLERYYTSYVNPKKGMPTLTEFVYYYADKIRTTV